LGYGDSEIFPKQTTISEERGNVGNWLNMPYFDADKTVRYAVGPEGRGMSLPAFLDYAFKLRITEEEFRSLSPMGTTLAEMEHAPPCLQHLCKIGIAEGSKNNTMFSMGVLAKKMQPEGWEALLDVWNQRYVLKPALTSEEMATIVKSLRKKDYFYRCNEQPLVSHCDKRTCRLQKFGIGASVAPEISSVSVLDTQPPLFFVCLSSGGTVECTTEDLISSRNFQKAALSQMRVLLPMYKADAWQLRIQQCLEEAVVIEAPREVSTTGAMEDLMAQFLTDRFAARDRDEILLGKPWLDDEEKMYTFRLRDLTDHLDRHKFREMTRSQIVSRIREMGGLHGFFNIRGIGVNVWRIPQDAVHNQMAPLDPPVSDNGDM
jgi:hypothetical protein